MGFTLRCRLQTELKAPHQPSGGGRKANDLFAGAKQAKRRDAERKAAEAKTRRIAALEKLAKSEEKVWQTVEAQLAERHWTYHAKAVEQIRHLRDLADYQKTRAEFNRRPKELRAQVKVRVAITKGLKPAGLL